MGFRATATFAGEDFAGRKIFTVTHRRHCTKKTGAPQAAAPLSSITVSGAKITPEVADDIYFEMMFDDGPTYSESFAPVAPQSGENRCERLKQLGASYSYHLRKSDRCGDSHMPHNSWSKGWPTTRKNSKQARLTLRRKLTQAKLTMRARQPEPIRSTWDEMAGWLDDMAAANGQRIDASHPYYDRLLQVNGIDVTFYDRHWEGLDQPGWEDEAWEREAYEQMLTEQHWEYYHAGRMTEATQNCHGYTMDPFEEAYLAEPDYYDGGWDEPYFDDYDTFEDRYEHGVLTKGDMVALNGESIDYDYSDWPEFNLSQAEWEAMEAEELALEQAAEADEEELEASFEHFPVGFAVGRKMRLAHEQA